MYVFYPIPVYPYFRNSYRQAYAKIAGGPLAEDIQGYIIFSDTGNGTEVFVELKGLPPYQYRGEGENPIGPHGFHIHEHGNCAIGDQNNPFQEAGGHWNPTNQPHGNHAGDFPVVFSNNGYTRMSFFTDKFKIDDIIGKAVIIHEYPDDYRSQPSGDAGRRLACGIIQMIQ